MIECVYMNPFSIKEALTFGWEAFKKDPWFYVLVTATLTIFSMLVNMLTDGGHAGGAFIGFFISLAASAVVTVAYARLALAAADGHTVGWDGLWAPQHILNMFIATILQSLIVLVGLVLLIVPGIIASLLLSMTQLSIVDKSMHPLEALKTSYRLTKKHVWLLFQFMVLLVLLNLAGLIALVVGLFVTLPVSLIAVAYVYKKLAALEEPMVVQNATPAP